jgi:hypothetical protein
MVTGPASARTEADYGKASPSARSITCLTVRQLQREARGQESKPSKFVEPPRCHARRCGALHPLWNSKLSARYGHSV